jgi:hypothetical protein
MYRTNSYPMKLSPSTFGLVNYKIADGHKCASNYPIIKANTAIRFTLMTKGTVF